MDISIVIPTYNRASFIHDCVTSALLALEKVAGEILIIDDGSTDDTERIIQNINDSRIRYFYIPHAGAQVARNYGLKKARGTYIKFFDSDDIFLPNSITHEIDCINDSNADAVVSPFYMRKPSGTERLIDTPNEKSISANTIICSGLVSYGQRYIVRQKFLHDHNITWNPELPYFQDIDFILRIFAHGARIVVNNKPTLIVQNHLNNRISKINATDEIESKSNIVFSIHNEAERIMRLHDIWNIDIQQKWAAIYHYCAKLAIFNHSRYTFLLKKAIETYPGYYPTRSAEKLCWKVIGPYRTDVMLHYFHYVKKYVHTVRHLYARE